ncbi:MAG TPA: M14 family zinc carboxypeptidase, partial [Chloroflexota bacterium]
MVATSRYYKEPTSQEIRTLADWPITLQTRAERTDYQETSLHADVVAFLRELRRRTDLIRIRSMGKSAEGRGMPIVAVSKRGAFTPAAARRAGQPIVMIQANIHAGEVEGKEAVLALMRDLTLGGLEPELLDQLTLVIIPILNPDGNDRISTENRKLDLAELEGQIGPPGGVGIRNTGEGWNLNRDYMKQEAIESNHLARAYGSWWPHVFVDCHTTDGSIHAYDLTFDTAHTPLSGHAAPIEYVRR